MKIDTPKEIMKEERERKQVRKRMKARTKESTKERKKKKERKKGRKVNDRDGNLFVCHPVVVEIGAGREAFAADLALVRFLSGVDPPVCVEGTGRGECLTTHVTGVGLLT